MPTFELAIEMRSKPENKINIKSAQRGSVTGRSETYKPIIRMRTIDPMLSHNISPNWL